MDTDDKMAQNNTSVTLQRTSLEFKRGFSFAVNCIADLLKYKDESYTIKDLQVLLGNFQEINKNLQRKHDKTFSCPCCKGEGKYTKPDVDGRFACEYCNGSGSI